MTNKEKFLALVSPEDSGSIERNRERIKNREILRESQQIALKVLLKLDDLGWPQKDLAEKMGVSPQQISKIASGRENLTLETQIKLQNMLDIPILASYYEQNTAQWEQMILFFEKQIFTIAAQATVVIRQYQSNSVVYENNFNYSPFVA